MTGSISGKATLNAPSATEETIFVAAKQTFAGGPTVTVKSQAADVLAGAYTLSLPVAAPVLGHYDSAGTPPIPLAAETALAGHYSVEASATGYGTQSLNEDISSVDATNQDFALPPR